jgi:hypothetical protein
MKVTIDIDCTPEEARTFFGLPDVRPMQAALLSDIEQRVRQALSSSDPETLMKTWAPLGMQGFEQFQKMFWSEMTGSRPKVKTSG